VWWQCSRTNVLAVGCSPETVTVQLKVSSGQLPQDVETDVAIETDTEDWSRVVTPGKIRRWWRDGPAPSSTHNPQAGTGFSKKPPAILVRNVNGKSYRATILAVRNCDLTREEIGTSVTMR